MDFYDVIKQRRSIRGYQDKAVPPDSLERIATAVNLAPSACNRQPWQLLAVANAELRAKICGIYSAKWLAEAPVILAAVGDRESCWKRLEGNPIIDVDMGIFMEHAVLAATAEGLGTCWVCAFNVAAMNQALNIQAPWSVTAISPLGYPAAPAGNLQRKPVTEIFKVIK